MSLESIPLDVGVAYGHLDYTDLENLCFNDKSLRRFCERNDFWVRLMNHKYPGYPVSPNVDARELYKISGSLDAFLKWVDVPFGLGDNIETLEDEIAYVLRHNDQT